MIHTIAGLEAAREAAGRAGDTVGAAALTIALHRALPPAVRDCLEADHQASLACLSDTERAKAERAAADLSWVGGAP